MPAGALAWVWYLLAAHPEVEAKVHEEVDRTLHGRLPDKDDLPKLHYISCVVKETLRLYPPTWLSTREVAIECELGGYPLHKGQKLLFSPYVVQRDPRFFEQPDQFIPERWLAQTEATPRAKYTYFPFGGGPRTCIGASLSMIELVIVVATIARQFRLRLVDAGVTPNPRTTLLPNQLRLLLEQRR